MPPPAIVHWPSPPLRNTKTPVLCKGRGSRGTTFINSYTAVHSKYRKPMFRYSSLGNGERNPASPTIRSAKQFRSPFGIRGGSVHTCHRLSEASILMRTCSSSRLLIRSIICRVYNTRFMKRNQFLIRCYTKCFQRHIDVFLLLCLQSELGDFHRIRRLHL